jgi:hypothetical protein
LLTAGPKETRAWEIRAGATALEAVGGMAPATVISGTIRGADQVRRKAAIG